MSQKFLNPIEVDGQVSAEYLDLSTTTSHSVNAGEIAWNSIDGTFDIGLLNGVTLQAGQEMYFYGKATEAISNGNAVMFAGVQGDHILIAKATPAAINANPEYFMGVATQDFTTNQFGYVTAFGNVRGLNTTGYTLGTVLYFDSNPLSSPGLLTGVKPTAPNAKVEVAAVVKVHATQGILMVRPHTMPKLSDVQDVDINTVTLTQNSGIFWNQLNSRFENKSIVDALGYTPANVSHTHDVVVPVSQYTWSHANLPNSYTNGIQSSFVSASQGWQSFGSVLTMKTYLTGGGATLQMYVPYSPTYGGTGMQVRFGNYDVSTGNSWTAWKTLLASDNYQAYSYFSGDVYGTRFYDYNNTAYYLDPASSSNLYNVTANSFVKSGGTSSQFLKADGSVDSNTYLTSVTNISGYSGTLISEDNRTISPSELGANRLKFGFTSWANNNTSPYADFIHLRSYQDASGGSDNLIMFKKSGIGMRIWQQTYGSSTAYSTYKDIAFTDGTNATGSWPINVTGTAGSLSNMNISQFTNNSGYITGYTETDPTVPSYVKAITTTNISNWNTAYGWGNHASAGYLTSLPSHNHDDRYYTESESDSIFLRYYGINQKNNFQKYVDTVGAIRFDQVNDYNNLLNPPGGYNYGGVLSLRGDNFGFQLWGSHTGNFYFKTQWDDDQYSGWREVIHSSNIASYAASTSHTHTFDSLTSKTGGTGTYQTSGDFRAPIFYDSDNTGFYSNPAGLSNFSTIIGNSIQVHSTTPVLTIQDTDSSGASQVGYISYRNTGGVETAWLGFGSASDTDFTVRNTLGRVLLNGTYSEAVGNFRAPIFYDSNNTGYYLDPASTSVLNGLTLASYSFANNGFQAFKNIGTTTPSWPDTNHTLGLENSDAGHLVLNFHRGGYTSNNLVYDGSFFSFDLSTKSSADFRAPRFYDLDNTGYYLDPASTSNINTLSLSNISSNFSIFGGYGPGSGPGLGFENQGTFARIAFWGADFYEWDSGQIMTMNNGYVAANNSFRAPIFYDSNNTSYYFDGSSTGDSIRCAGDIVAYYSDERLKDKKGNIENALKKVLSLNGFYYTPNDKAQELGYKYKEEVGVSAQEVEEVLPQIIKDAPIGQGYKTLDYGKLTPLLIEAIKEQQKQIEELKELVNKLITK